MKTDNLITVGALKEILSTYDDDLVVVLSSDGEGNSYNPLWAHEKMVYVLRDGDVHYGELTQELIDGGFDEEDIYDGSDGIRALVLWP